MSRDETLRSGRLRELALLFLRLGTTAFGGLAAHIAMMEEEVVRRRGGRSNRGGASMTAAVRVRPVR
jgi:chromate transport protein ChrA